MTDKGSRTKRGLVNIIGTIANELFGTLDERFAKHHEEQIASVIQNEKHALELIKNQTTIADITLDIINKSKVQSIKQLQIVTADVTKVNKDTIVNNIAIYLMTLIVGYKDTQYKLLDMLNNNQNGKFNSLIMSPEMFEKQIEIIRNNLPPNKMLPTDGNKDQQYELYNLISIKSKMKKNYVIFKITVPIIEREYLRLYNMVPAPIRNGNVFISIQTKKTIFSYQR